MTTATKKAERKSVNLTSKAPLVKKGRPLENIEKEIRYTMVQGKKSSAD
jgi:hypothetical protein